MALALIALAACASDGGGALGDVDGKLDDVRSATIDLEFAGTTLEGEEPSAPVGFRLAGPFSFESDGDYPLLQLEYTRLLGGDEQQATVTSTGTKVYVEAGDGRTVEVPPSQLTGLRIEGQQSSGFERLRLSEWVHDPKTTTTAGKDVTTGKLDVPKAFTDLAALAAELGVPDTGQLDELGDMDRDRLEKLVRTSDARIESDSKTDMLRLLAITVDLAPDATALGELVATRLTIRIALDDVNEPMEPPAPPS